MKEKKRKERSVKEVARIKALIVAIIMGVLSLGICIWVGCSIYWATGARNRMYIPIIIGVVISVISAILMYADSLPTFESDTRKISALKSWGSKEKCVKVKPLEDEKIKYVGLGLEFYAKPSDDEMIEIFIKNKNSTEIMLVDKITLVKFFDLFDVDEMIE